MPNDNSSQAGIMLFPSKVQPKYDPEEFLTGSSDAKGHSAKFWFRGPVGLDRQIEIILASKKFPYKTASDVLRHALVRHLYWLASLEGEIPSVMFQVEVILTNLRAEQYHQDFKMVFDDISKTIERYVGDGARGEAMRVASECRSMMERMPDGFWKDRYLKEFDKRFGYLFEGSGTALGAGLNVDGMMGVEDDDE